MRLVQFCRRGAEGSVRVGVERQNGVVDLKAFDQSVPATMREFLDLGEKGMDSAQRWDRLHGLVFMESFG